MRHSLFGPLRWHKRADPRLEELCRAFPGSIRSPVRRSASGAETLESPLGLPTGPNKSHVHIGGAMGAGEGQQRSAAGEVALAGRSVDVGRDQVPVMRMILPPVPLKSP